MALIVCTSLHSTRVGFRIYEYFRREELNLPVPRTVRLESSIYVGHLTFVQSERSVIGIINSQRIARCLAYIVQFCMLPSTTLTVKEVSHSSEWIYKWHEVVQNNYRRLELIAKQRNYFNKRAAGIRLGNCVLRCVHTVQYQHDTIEPIWSTTLIGTCTKNCHCSFQYN